MSVHSRSCCIIAAFCSGAIGAGSPAGTFFAMSLYSCLIFSGKLFHASSAVALLMGTRGWLCCLRIWASNCERCWGDIAASCSRVNGMLGRGGADAGMACEVGACVVFCAEVSGTSPASSLFDFLFDGCFPGPLTPFPDAWPLAGCACGPGCGVCC